MRLVVFQFFMAFVATELENDIRVERIVGGRFNSIENAPYMAAILKQGRLKCGGSILSAIFVVTAAHCLLKVGSMSDLMIRIGSNDYRSGGQERSVIYYATHPNYDEETDDYDCGVLRVDKPFVKAGLYQELELPAVNRIIGERLLVSGWGYTSERGKPSSDLQSINVTVLPEEVCYNVYRKFGWAVPTTDFCAGNLEGGRDSCTGDSGGPAVRNNSVLIGIVSFGYGCARVGVPSFYTNVYLLNNWIYTKIRNPLWQEY